MTDRLLTVFGVAQRLGRKGVEAAAVGRLTTLDGYRALASAIMEHCWANEVRRWKRYGANDYGVAAVVAVLTGDL